MLRASIDLAQPEMDGIAIVQPLRAHQPESTTRLIALTGYGAEADLERTRSAGFHAHIVKPASIEAILHAITGT
jgi:CheY-like chemotaxis protein